MIASAEKRDPSMIDRKLDFVALDPELIQLLPWLTGQTTIEMCDLERIATGLRAGRILPQEVRVLARGGVLSHLASSAVAELLDALIDSGTEGYWTAVEILGMYLHQKSDAHEEFRPQLRRLMKAIDVTTRGDASLTMDTHFYCGVASWLLRHGSKDEDAALTATMLAEQSVRYCVDESGRLGGRSVFEKLLPDVFGDSWSVAWPILSGSMEAHRDRIWTFESLLSIHDREGKTVASPIFLVPWEVLRAWCHKNPGFAPAFLMRIAPRFEEVTPLPTEQGAQDVSRESGQQRRGNGARSCVVCWTISVTVMTSWMLWRGI